MFHDTSVIYDQPKAPCESSLELFVCYSEFCMVRKLEFINWFYQFSLSIISRGMWN
ncbi:predicted protein [Botrytis cinerea T4]|uniref:Uncharacterized protein n=1 Tax=Botryotinia fuckeliana (strain T4) TaxID=999810 RepID=G2YXB8_BOTF4|nr:predicted protein [Botrytis cinerea T4]